MTGPGAEPDKKVPSGPYTIVANSPSLAAFANTTQVQWKQQQTNSVLGSAGGLVQACEQLQQNPLIQSLQQLGSQLGSEVNSLVSEVLTGLQALSDFLCSLVTGNSSGGSTTANTIINGVSSVESAINSSPLVSGILALGNQAQNLIIQFINGLQSFADSLCSIATGVPGSTGTSPTTLLHGINAAANTALGNPFISGLIQSGQAAGAAAGQNTNNQLSNLVNGITTSNLFAPVTTAVNTAIGMPAPTPGAAPLPVSSITTALSNIPNQNILGNLGPANLGGSTQGIVDSVVQGITNTGATNNSLGTLANAVNQSSNTAVNAQTIGVTNSTTLANRAVTRVGYHAIDPTIDAVFDITSITGSSATTIGVTSSASAIGMLSTPDGGVKESIVWYGGALTNITAVYVNVYSINTSTGVASKVYASSDISGGIANTDLKTPNYFTLPTASFITAGQGNWYGVEMTISGTGTYSIAGLPNHWAGQNPNTIPKQLGASRTTGLPTAPSTITLSGVYSNNVPWFGLSGAAGPSQRPPRTTEYSTAGTYTFAVPAWMQAAGTGHFDIITLGAGGGGYVGAILGIYGDGGSPGAFGTPHTLVYGVDIPLSTTTFSVTVGAGGGGGAPGSAGGSSKITITGYGTITAAGGAAGIGQGPSPAQVGGSPGSELFDGIYYYGGVAQNNPGSNGVSPGGGGGGGSDFFFGAGGAGADGAVWITYYT